MATMRPMVGMIGLAAALMLVAPAASSDAAAQAAPLPGPDRPSRSSLASPQAQASGAISRSQLRSKLNKLAKAAPSSSGVYVYDTAARGRPELYGSKEGKRRKLASNTKLFTTATALDRLGAGGRIETVVRARGNINGNGKLRGDLYLVGGGDPTLDDDGVDSLARQVAAAGVERVDGTIYADDSVFDRKRGVPDSGYGPSPFIAPLSGLVYRGSTYSGDPALEAGGAFKSALRDRGVRVGGAVKRGRPTKKVRARTPLGTVESPTIAAIVEATNEPSNNFYAEMLLKRLWATSSRKGTTTGGAKAVERFAKSQRSKIQALDGSGLTEGNRSSPRDVVRLLSAMRRHEAGQEFFESLPRAGKEGTLDERMEGTAAAGSCRAKTGTISGVSTLSGYCRAGRGQVAFSVLINGVGDLEAAHRIQDKVAVAIARYRP